MHSFTDDEFDAVVQRAIDSIPERFRNELDNVTFMVDDEPSPEEADPDGDGPLGYYDGVSLLERADGYGANDWPDAIIIFKGPHERLEGTRQEIEEQVRMTVVHEVGHYFGMTEEQIERMGYR